MKKIINYLASALIGASILLPNYACGKSSSDRNSSQVPFSLSTNIRTALDDIIASQNNATAPLEVVVGLPQDLAQEIAEGWAAHFIQTRLNDELQAKYGSYIPVVRKFDFEISDTFDKDRIFIGFESTNKHVAKIRSSMLDQQYRFIQTDLGKVEGYKVYGKNLFVISGDKLGNVMASGFALSEYDHTLNNGQIADFNCSIANVSGYYPDVSITVEKP